MGYALTTIAYFGVELSPDEAELVFEALVQANMQADLTLDRKGAEQATTEAMYPYANGATMLASDGSDSRIDNLVLDKGRKHGLGIKLASRGYGCNDNIATALRRIAKRTIARFEAELGPVLALCGITREPTPLTLSQVH